MNKLINFVKQFTKTEIKELENIEKIDNRYFYVVPELRELKEKINLKPYSAGLPIGEIKQKKFVPAFAFLDILKDYTERKVMLNLKGETMFLYNRDVFEANFVQSGVKEGICLVMNENNEVLGYGEMKAVKKKKLIHPLLDRGDFLRKEEKLNKKTK